VLGTISAEGLLDHVKRVGERLRRGIEALGHPLVSHVRGAGLLLGVVLTAPASKAVAAAGLEAGFLVNPIQPDVVRLAPPLILSTEQVDAFLAALPAMLDGAA
jgi:acetylornithine aminotransferase